MSLHDIDKGSQDRGAPVPNSPDLSNSQLSPHHPIIAPYTAINGSILLNNASNDIQNAIDAISARGGGKVAITNGTHLMNSNIVVPSGVTLVGETGTGCIIDFQNQPFHIVLEGTPFNNTGTVSVNNNSSTVTGVGTAFDSTYIGQSILLKGRWFTITAVTDATHLTISQPFDADSISGQTNYVSTIASGITLQDFTVQNSTSTDGAIIIQDVTSVTINNVTVNTSTIGMSFNRANGVNLLNSNILSCGTGVQIVNSAVWTLYNFYIYASTGDNLYCSTFYNASVSNATISSAGRNNINMNGCEALSIYDMENTTPVSSGISLTRCTDIEIFAQTVRDSGSDGMKLVDACSRVTIHNCTLKNNGGYGVNIASVGTDRTTITSSYFTGNVSGTINNAGTNTINANNN